MREKRTATSENSAAAKKPLSATSARTPMRRTANMDLLICLCWNCSSRDEGTPGMWHQMPTPGCQVTVALELQAKRELKVALALARAATAFGEYFAESGGVGGVEADIGRAAAAAVAAPIRMVPDVVRFGAELEAKLFVNWDRLEQSHIPILIPGLVDQVANSLR